MARPETVVDYEAWERGYMPPSEHGLIDQLAYRGARVVLGGDWGNFGMWVVVRGKTPSREIRKKLMEMIDLALEDSEQADGQPRAGENWG